MLLPYSRSLVGHLGRENGLLLNEQCHFRSPELKTHTYGRTFVLKKHPQKGFSRFSMETMHSLIYI